MANVNSWVWEVSSLYTLPQVDQQTDVVVSATYTVTGTDGTASASYTSTQQFTYTGGSFTPFADLTQDQVIGWVQEAIGQAGIDNIQEFIQTQVNEKENPIPEPTIQPLPWSN